MNKIVALDTHIANLIAAGEVVERPLSVVKELVENAIDANATVITIHLREAGLSMIRVEDNGDGMSPDDARLAFTRHATSKIKSASDLQSILTLGFRGEALPSIAAVSHVRVDTSDGVDATQVRITQGVMESATLAPRPQGTTISVEKLFVNTPARLKFLKHPKSETDAVLQFVSKLALATPHVRFQLVVDDREVLSTSGSGDRAKTIAQVLGVPVAKDMVALQTGAYDLIMTGMISSPLLTRSSRSHIHLSVNGRVIQDIGLAQAIKDAYGHRIPVDRYPVAVIDISIDPSFLDVNVSPTKLQVQFSNAYQLKSLLQEAIQAVLGEHISIQEAIHPLQGEQTTIDWSKVDSVRNPAQEVRFPTLQFLTQLQKSYLIAQGDLGMYVIDQHAAAERIRYEAYLEVMKHPPTSFQQLMMPLQLPVSQAELSALQGASNKIKQAIGFPFTLDAHHVVIEEIPTWFREGLELDYAQALVQQALLGTTAALIDDTARLLACKRSIKFNDSLNVDEAQSLIDQLSQCDDPFHCPHGRPTIVRYSYDEFRRMFGR
jgi:DNA mismatch repair protein MutL